MAHIEDKDISLNDPEPVGGMVGGGVDERVDVDVELEVIHLGEESEGVQRDGHPQTLSDGSKHGGLHGEETTDERSDHLDASTLIEQESQTTGNEQPTLNPLPTPTKQRSKSLSLHLKSTSPPPPPSPSFIPRSTTSTPPGISITPPANDSRLSPWVHNATEDNDLQPTWVDGSGSRRRSSWIENGRRIESRVGDGDSSDGGRVPTPLPASLPFESISLADDDSVSTSAHSRRPNLMKPSQSGSETWTNGEERRSGLGGFLRRSSSTTASNSPRKNSTAKTSGNGNFHQTMTRDDSIHEEKDHTSQNQISQEASEATPSPTPSSSTFRSPSTTPSQGGGRIAAPPAIPHSANPTIAALILKGLDPNTSPSYLATSPINASAPEADKKERKDRRTSFLMGLKKGNKHEGKGKGKVMVLDTDGTIPTGQAKTTLEVQHPATGPSMLDKVRSHTRQAHLPPKAHEEDEAHLHAWETMMAAARAADIKRLERQAAMREEREKKLKDSLPVWESILAMYGDGSKTGWKEMVIKDPKLRKVWEEGCPSHLRGRVWAMCIGNGLALSKGSFKSCNMRARRAIESGRFPSDVLRQIDESTLNVFPVLKLFQPGSPLQDELKDLICAWYVSRTDEGLGYVPGISLVAAMLLMTMSPPLAFVALRNLLERGVLRAFYSGLADESEAYFRIFDNLQADLFPKIYANCKHLGIRLPTSYFSTMFLHQLPFEASCRVWDQILLQGDGYIFRVALAILAILEPRLYFPDRNEILSILEGRNPATLAIVAREKERARQKGLTFEEDLDGVLSVFHVDEKAIFERLSEDNWKESRYERLAQRELPDI